MVSNKCGNGVLGVLDFSREVCAVGGRAPVGLPREVDHSTLSNHDASRRTDADGRVVGSELKSPKGGRVVSPWHGDIEGPGRILGHGASVTDG